MHRIETLPNYAFKRTADLALRSKQNIVPQPLNAALDFFGKVKETKLVAEVIEALPNLLAVNTSDAMRTSNT